MFSVNTIKCYSAWDIVHAVLDITNDEQEAYSIWKTAGRLAVGQSITRPMYTITRESGGIR